MELPFIGPSYQARTARLGVSRSINLYPETIEDPTSDDKDKFALIGTPGRYVLDVCPKTPYRGVYPELSQRRLYCVAGDTFYEFQVGVGFLPRGTLRTSSGNVSMASNPTEVCIVDGKNGYIYNLFSGSFTQISASGFLGGKTVRYQDGYFITQQPLTNNFSISGLNDGLSWSGLDRAKKEGAVDEIVAIEVNRREFYLFGATTTEVWYDTGANNFPLAPVPGVFIEQGCVASFSVAKLDSTIYWIGRDRNGMNVVYRLNGYNPERVSTHAIELMISQQFGAADSVTCYSYQEEGHTFYCVGSPISKSVLCYDVLTGLWHERCSFSATGELSRDRAAFAAFIASIQFQFDYSDGRIYVISSNLQTDDGNPIPRIRVGQHYVSEQKNVFYDEMQIDMEVGGGLDEGVFGDDPYAILRVSRDGGKTFGSERTTKIGKIGENRVRARFKQLGRGRDMVFWFQVNFPVKTALVAAYFDVKKGTS